jgi:CRP/FNR family transcriptional regulator, anaerobic regulatory protein
MFKFLAMGMIMKRSIAPKCNTCRIRNCSILRQCDEHTLETLSDAKQYLFFRKKESIIMEGEENKGCFFIASGVVKLEINCKNGRSLIAGLCGQGDHFGHRSSQEHNTSSYSVVAVEDTMVCCLSTTDYAKMISNHPDFQKGIINTYIKELAQAEARSICLAQKTVKQKVADTLLRIAAAYQYHNSASGIRVHLDRQDMADMAGTTREQVSKVLLEFMQDGLLRFRAKHFKFINLQALKAIVDPVLTPLASTL